MSMCTTVAHNSEYSSDNICFNPPDNHYSSRDVYWRRGRAREGRGKCLDERTSQ